MARRERCLVVSRVALGITFAFFVSFTVAGYQALLPVLVDDGVYGYLCPSHNHSSPQKSTYKPQSDHNKTSPTAGCTAQVNQLNLMFTIAIGLLNMAALPVGFIISQIGPRLTSTLGAFIISMGVLLFALSSQAFPAWIAGYTFMAIGGPAVAFPLLSLPALIPKHSGLIFSLCVAAFDGSAAIMLFLSLIHNSGGYSVQSMFLVYLIFPLGLMAASWIIYDPPPPNLFAKCRAFRCSNDSDELEEESQVLLQPESLNTDQPIEIEQDLPFFGYQQTVLEIVFSWPFLLITIWFAVYLIAKYFYILTLDLQLLWLTGSKTDANTGSFVFSILLPASAIFTPISAYILDSWGGEYAVLVIALISLLVSVLSIVPVYPLQFVTMTLFVFNRFFFFGTAPFLMGKFFGDRGTSVLYGIALFLASCISYSNYGWSALAVANNENFFPINLTQNIVCTVVGFGLAVFYFILRKKPHQEVLVTPKNE